MKKEIITRKHDNSTIESIRNTVDKMVDKVSFENITIRDICSEVGITVGTFYNYFSSKNDLLLDRYKRYMDFFEKYYEENLIEQDEIEALKEIFRVYLNYAKSRVYAMYKQYFQIMINEYERWDKVKPNFLAETIVKIVSRGQEKNIITNRMSADDICSMLLIIVNGIAVQYLTRSKEILSNENIFNEVYNYIDSLRIINN